VYDWHNSLLPVPWEWVSLTGELNTNHYYHGIRWEMNILSIDNIEREKNRTIWIKTAEFLRMMRQNALNLLLVAQRKMDCFIGVMVAVGALIFIF
jgi:hypothetical protein